MIPLCLIASAISDFSLQRRYSLRFPLSLVFCVLASAALLARYPTDLISVGKGLILTQIFILALYIDARIHEIPNWINMLLLLTGLIRWNLSVAVVGLFLVSMPFLILGLFSKGGIGAGDVKFLAACGFSLGPVRIFLGTTFGLSLFCIIHLYSLMSQNKLKKRYAMAPYLSAGCFFAYLFF